MIIFPYGFTKHKQEVPIFFNFLNHLILHSLKKWEENIILFPYGYEFLFQQTCCDACLKLIFQSHPNEKDENKKLKFI
jgi:hypothetical protein